MPRFIAMAAVMNDTLTADEYIAHGRFSMLAEYDG